MKEIQKRFGLEDYKILSYSLYGKHNAPFVGIICEKNNLKYFVKTPLIENKLSRLGVQKEYKLLNRYYKNKLNPELINNGIKTNYIQKSTLSFSMNTWSGEKNIKRAINWLIQFHNSKHKNGIGQIHGDFSFDDIILLKNTTMVFDWEDYHPNKEQLIDIYYFCFRMFAKKGKVQDRYLKKFIDSLIQGNNPLLRYYVNRRKIKYTKERRIKAFKQFLKFRIKRRKKFYNIPNHENYMYSRMQEFINCINQERRLKKLKLISHKLLNIKLKANA